MGKASPSSDEHLKAADDDDIKYLFLWYNPVIIRKSLYTRTLSEKNIGKPNTCYKNQCNK